MKQWEPWTVLRRGDPGEFRVLSGVEGDAALYLLIGATTDPPRPLPRVQVTVPQSGLDLAWRGQGHFGGGYDGPVLATFALPDPCDFVDVYIDGDSDGDGFAARLCRGVPVQTFHSSTPA